MRISGLATRGSPRPPQEAESNPQCRRLQLKDLIISEMQRLTKYPLLLENILKHTEGRDWRRGTHQGLIPTVSPLTAVTLPLPQRARRSTTSCAEPGTSAGTSSNTSTRR